MESARAVKLVSQLTTFRKACIFVNTNLYFLTGVLVALESATPPGDIVRCAAFWGFSLRKADSCVCPVEDKTGEYDGRRGRLPCARRDFLNLSDEQADMLIAEGWAEPAMDRRSTDKSRPPKPINRIEC